MFSSFFSINNLLFYILFFIPALTIHECAHAFMANKLGDPTAKNMGRLTLNPLAHLDLFGTLAILLIGFGWAKPVQINPYNFGNIRRDSALVALAGPASNMLIAAIVILILRILPYNLSQESLLGSIGIIFAEINIILAVFNLIPLGPLDGFKIVSGLLPTELAQKWEESNQLSYIALIILLFLPIQGQTLVSMLINKISSFIWMLIF